MLIDLYDTSEMIRINKLKEVTNPMLFSKGAVPSPDGLLSTEIFGVSIKDRKETYAYIDLHDYFLNPFIYKLIKRLNRKFESVVHGSRKFVIINGELVEDEKDGQTGLKFLYNNWEKINWEKNNSSMRNERIDVLSAYKRNIIFVKYWIVCPAYYRDVNLQSLDSGKISHHEVNDKYSKLIRLASLITDSNNFDFVLNSTRARIQDTLVEIYDLFKGKLEKKQGMIRRNLLGKSLDYGSRSVISAPTFHANVPEDMEIDFYHCGIPLAQCCSLFTPFIVPWVRNYFRREFEMNGYKYPFKQKNGDIIMIHLKDPEIYFNDEYIKKQIDNFIFNYSGRFTPIELPIEEKTNYPVYFSFVGRIYEKGTPESESPIIDRPATWCDIIYQAAVDVTADKMVYITRYPITDYFGTFPNQITVMSTNKTIPVYINNKIYSHYPRIDLNMSPNEVAISFIDTVSMSNLYLHGLGGDYDGDQVTIKGVFSQEANNEARELMMSKSHILNIYGENMRTTTNEGIQTLYMMTKFKQH